MICATFKHSPVFRFGGDEFVVVLEGSDLENVDELIGKLEDEVNRKMQDNALTPWERGNAAIGYAQYTDGDSLEGVFKRADKAMYARKMEMKSGKE